jgi:hypothetical protein
MLVAEDLAAMRASLSTSTGYGAVEVESYRQDVGSLLDALEAAHAEASLLQQEARIQRAIGDGLAAEMEHLRVEVEAAIAEAATMRAWAEEAAAAENANADDARRERAAVVAFLRGSDDDLVADYGDDIERGEHRREESAP